MPTQERKVECEVAENGFIRKHIQLQSPVKHDVLQLQVLASLTRFPSSPLIKSLTIRVPFFLLCGFNKGTQKEKGQKGTTGEPLISDIL